MIIETNKKESRGYQSWKCFDIDVIFVVDARSIHKSGHLTRIFVQLVIVIIHGGFGFISVQEVPELGHTVPTEHTEYISLLLRKLRWGFSAKLSEGRVQELRDSCQTQMGESRTLVDQRPNRLK